MWLKRWLVSDDTMVVSQSRDQGGVEMSPERADAYRRVIHTIKELGPSKLVGEEQDRLRLAADSLIFTAEIESDGAARAALEDAESLCDALVESGRWEAVTARRLARDVYECGPGRDLATELKAA
jgi:hypothetical protein